MTDAILSLLKLQEIDNAIVERISCLETPEDFETCDHENPLRRDYRFGRKEFDALNKDLADAKGYISELKRKLASLIRSKRSIKTNVDMHACNQEIEKILYMLRRAEEREKEANNKLYTHLIYLKDLECRIADGEKATVAYREGMRKKMTALENEIDALYMQRSLMRSFVRTEHYELYMSLINSCFSNVVAPARKRICTGCHILITRQVYIDLINPGQIIFCPNCSRILYRDVEDIRIQERSDS